MAIFNMTAGGFYGKLGETVGQRWRNLRTLRTYVIPANPRTEKQQANRGKFKQATEFSQIANQMNYSVTAWNSVDLPLWNCRVKTARELQDMGKTGLSLIPLFPSSFVLPYSIDSIGIYEMGAGNVLTCVVSGTLPLVDRQVSILVQTQATAESEKKLSLYIGEYFADATPRIMFKCDNYEEFNSLTRCVICSNDDEDSATDAIYSGDRPLLPVQQETHTFDISTFNVSRNGNVFTFVTSEPYFAPSSSSVSFTLTGVSAGRTTQLQNLSATLRNENGYFAWDYTQAVTNPQEILAFTAIGAVSIHEITAETPLVKATAESVLKHVNSTDLTRDTTLSFGSISADGDSWKIRLNSTFISPHVASAVSATSRTHTKFSNGEFISNPVEINDATAGQLNIVISKIDSNTGLIAFDGDYIAIPAFSFTSEGVTYVVAPQTHDITYYSGNAEWDCYNSFGGDFIMGATMYFNYAMPADFIAKYANLSESQFLDRFAPLPTGYAEWLENGDFGCDTEDLRIDAYENGVVKMSIDTPASGDVTEGTGASVTTHGFGIRDTTLGYTITFTNKTVGSGTWSE